MKKNDIKVYTSETCGHCSHMKNVFTENKIKFEEVVTKDNPEEWVKITTLTGIPTTPTIEINGKYFVPGRDYNTPEQLIEHIKVLDPEKEEDFTVERKLEEGFKTLVYSINQGFNRLFHQMSQLEKKNEPENKEE